ncbi:MAG: hypothetical protein Q8S36_00765 [Sulfuricurvum sp.]|nr:hypothetical protein [Sulfuricurvum sp.]
MREFLKKYSSALLGFFFFIALIFIIIKVIQIVIDTFSKINPAITTGIIAASTTIIVSVISVLYAKRIEHKSTLMKEHREKKVPFYDDLVRFILSFVFAEKRGITPLSEQEIINKLTYFTEDLIIWGSDDVLNAWIEFKKVLMTNAEQHSINVIFEVEKLLLVIRKDLGHANKGLIRGKLLSAFINDIDEYL